MPASRCMSRRFTARNDHHIAESCFKGLARALRAAVAIDPRAKDEVPRPRARSAGERVCRRSSRESTKDDVGRVKQCPPTPCTTPPPRQRRNSRALRSASCSCATDFMSGRSCWRRCGCWCTGCGWRCVDLCRRARHCVGVACCLLARAGERAIAGRAAIACWSASRRARSGAGR